MYRHAMSKLQTWKENPRRKPLILRGARQVGKTWLMKEFGRRHYPKVAYISCDNNERMRRLFEGDISMEHLLLGLKIESGVDIHPQDTLLIFDEVQEIPKVLTSLKYFNENAPEYAVLAAGSMLGVALHEGTSFPVGKVDFLDLYPLSFTEYLRATENEELYELLRQGHWKMMAPFRNRYVDLLRQYYFVGGMPEAVLSFLEQKNLEAPREVQLRLLESYEQDFSKHAPLETVPRLRMLWNSMPAQLAREKRKFLYGLIQKGARAREFEVALQWLLDCGLLHRVYRVTKPGIPLKAYQDIGAFKLFLLDVGLLAAMGDLDSRSILEGNRIFSEFKGALAEQYVCQQLVSDCGAVPFYWTAHNGVGEIDFLLQHKGNLLPLEVKAEENLRAKSLRVFCEKYEPLRALRISMSDYREESWMTNLPLYAVSLALEV